MANWFNRVQKIPHVQHSVCDTSYDLKTSCKMGQLVPVMVREVLPSDKFINLQSDIYLRLAPLMYPLMHRVKVKTHNFFTPLRIILGEDLYQDFLNGKVDLSSLSITIDDDGGKNNPFVNSLFDYLGIDINAAVYNDPFDEELVGDWTLVVLNPTPILAYFCIVRDWFLDSTLNAEQIETLDGMISLYRTAVTNGTDFEISDPDWVQWFDVFRVSYGKDYFNTARPTPQMGSDMYVLNRPFTFDNPPASNSTAVISGGSSYPAGAVAYNGSTAALNETTTIRDLWKREAIMAFEQHGNSFGSRIREQLAAHFGVIISDKRLMVPQYCGGSHSYVQISEVINTNSSVDSSALGAFAGKGSSFTRSSERNYFCEEHGVMLTLLSIVPDNGYCSGMDRLYFKKNIFDFALPEFNNVGWQPILNGEIFCDGTDADKATFGYQPRYSEYRSGISRAVGQFRDSNLLGWHLNRAFDSLPPLNDEFLKVQDTERVFNFDGTNGDCPIFVDCFNHVIMNRPISKEPDEMHLY